MKIPEQKIEEIRSAANIVEVVSDYVQLRKRGANYIGLCPFHTEKTPSFTVNEDKQIFYCFGCHTGGNAIKFVMNLEKISFPEAIQKLADKFGITITYEKEYNSGEQSLQEKLYEINNVAARFFSDNLLNRPEGDHARKYFDKRKLKIQTLRSFGLGYSLPSRESLYQYLHKNNVDLENAVHLGLLGKNQEGHYYDKFSGRIIFPIFSAYGRVIAFAGRILDPSETSAKYLNSPESSIYIKGRVLYGLSAAKDDIRKLDCAIIVEGYMDLITLHQAGVKNVVAVSGTALTDDQVQLLSRYTKNVILLFDADNAGIKASMRSIEILLKRDIEVKVLSLPAGEDPDSYINNYGRQKFEELIPLAKNFVEYQSGVFEANGMFSDPAKATEAIREIVKTLSHVGDEIKRSLLIKNISQKFNLREMLLEKELGKAIQAVRKNIRPSEIKFIQKENANSEQTKKQENSNLTRIETELVALAFEGMENILDILMEHIDPDDFSDPLHSEIMHAVYEAKRDGERIIAESLIEKFPEESTQDYLRRITMEPYQLSGNWEKMDPNHDDSRNLIKKTKDTINKFKSAKIDEEITMLQKELPNQSEPEQMKSAARINELSRQKLSYQKN